MKKNASLKVLFVVVLNINFIKKKNKRLFLETSLRKKKRYSRKRNIRRGSYIHSIIQADLALLQRLVLFEDVLQTEEKMLNVEKLEYMWHHLRFQVDSIAS